MPEPSPAYLFYPKDILSSGRVAALSPLEELWFRRALDQSWLHDGLPAEPADFAGWIGRGCTIKSAEKIISKFFTEHKKDKLKVVNPRQEIERTKWKRKLREKSRAGIISGQKRREKKQAVSQPQSLEELSDEHLFDSVQTECEQKRTIPIPIPIPKDLKEEEATALELSRSEPTELLLFLGKITSGVMKVLGLKTKRGLGNEQEWIEHGTIAFENGFTADQFLAAFSDIRQRHDYPIRPQYVTERLPHFIKKPGNGAPKLPTVAEKEAERIAAMADRKPPPKKITEEISP